MSMQSVPNLKRSRTEPSGYRDQDPDYYAKLSLEEKRKKYKCGSRYKTLDQITPWSEWRLKQKYRCESQPLSEVKQVLNTKVSVWQGDITQLEIDAIVNAANRSLLGGGGVDGAIHSAAGWSLREECEKLNGCKPGDAKITSGHRLPAKYILHTVGPMNEDRDILKSCYETCLQLVDEHNIKSVAFCCVATGVYGYPNEGAAHVALETIRSWLENEDHHEKIDRIIFCVFLDVDYKIYQRLMQLYFPRDEDITRDEDIPSVEMLQKRLNSLREIPNTPEDDMQSTEKSKSREVSPMEAQENIQSVSGALKVTPSSQESHKDDTQDVRGQDDHSVDIDQSDGQHANGDKSISEDNQNIDIPFTEEDNTPLSEDDKITKKDENVDAIFSENNQEDGALVKSQQDDIASSEKSQKEDLPSLKSTNNVQSQDSSLLNDDNQISQLSPQNTLQEYQTDDTPPPEKTMPPEETTPPPPDSPKDHEEMVNTQDVRQSSPMDTSCTDESKAPLSNVKPSGEGDAQLPILQKSVTEPAKFSGASEDK